MPQTHITIRAMVLGIFFAALFAYVSAYFENTRGIYVTATQVATLPYALLLVGVLLINPLLRLARVVRPMSVAELLMIFMMGWVSASVSSFGFLSPLIGLTGSLNNPNWVESKQWDVYVLPYLDEAYFLSQPGVQAKAAERADVILQLDELTKAYRYANALQTAKANHAREQEALTALEARSDAPATPREIDRAKREVTRAVNRLKKAQQAWEPYDAKFDIDTLIAEYDSRRASLQEELAAMNLVTQEPNASDEPTWADLSSKAYARVTVFRTGLGEERGSYPGFLKSFEESWSAWAARYRRTRRGMQALGHLEKIEQRLATLEADQTPDEQDALFIAEHLESAADAMRHVADPAALQAQKADLVEQEQRRRDRVAEITTEVAELNTERRDALLDRKEQIEDQIELLQDEQTELNELLAESTADIEAINGQIQTMAAVQVVIDELSLIREALAGPSPPERAELDAQLDAVITKFPGFDGTLGQYIVGGVPWGEWSRPLLRWGIIFVLVYLMLMGFNVLIFRQWAHHEKLIYPLAELPQFMAGGEGAPAGGLPTIYRTGLFWAGVTISASVLGWNGFVRSKVVPGLSEIPLVIPWTDYVSGSIFAGLAGAKASVRHEFIFTVIGLSFLIPANITYSLWLFRVISIVLILLMVWFGYGVNIESFPTDWQLNLNFLTALGGGALIIFALTTLYRCRQYIFCFFRPSSIASLEKDERHELQTFSFIFLASSLLFILILWLDMGAGLFLTVFCYLVIILITIALTRAVAEGGILGFQSHIGPWHLIRTLFGMDKTWTAPSLFAPIMVVYTIMFLDVKAFIAPTMANCLKLRDNLNLKRFRFHLGLILGVFGAVAVGAVTHLCLAYDMGGNAMDFWFYKAFPEQTYDNLTTLSKNPLKDTDGMKWWLAIGALAMVGLLASRRRFFWVPHPIGMIMLVNPLMNAYWFSIFLGWLCKRLVTKYGNTDTYTRTRNFFIGLIAGEVAIIIIALFVNMFLEINMNISLNRN